MPEEFVVVYKHLTMISLLALRKPTYPHIILIYGFLFELWVSISMRRIILLIAQYIYDGEDLGHPYTSGKNHFHEMNGDVGMAGWK